MDASPRDAFRGEPTAPHDHFDRLAVRGGVFYALRFPSRSIFLVARSAVVIERLLWFVSLEISIAIGAIAVPRGASGSRTVLTLDKGAERYWLCQHRRQQTSL